MEQSGYTNLGAQYASGRIDDVSSSVNKQIKSLEVSKMLFISSLTFELFFLFRINW